MSVTTTLRVGKWKAAGRLGREIKVSPKASVQLGSGRGIQFSDDVETVEVIIGIGKDHVAYLVMDVDAWKALNAGEEINITTTKEFEEGAHLPKKKQSPKNKKNARSKAR